MLQNYFLQGYDLFYNFLYFLKALWWTYVSLIMTTLRKILPTSKKYPCCYWFLWPHFHQLKSINGKKKIPEEKERKQTGQSRDEAKEGDEEDGKGKCGSNRAGRHWAHISILKELQIYVFYVVSKWKFNTDIAYLN